MATDAAPSGPVAQPAGPPPALGAPAAPIPVRAAPTLRVDVPVTFQMTRTRLLGPGATTLTESFRETWTIEVLPGAIVNLRSPRAAVPAYEVGQRQAQPDVPKTLLISEHDFGLLVGVEPRVGAEVDDGETGPSPAGRPVSLQLGKTGRGGTDVNLNWSEEEHYAIHIDVGTTAVF